MNITQLILPLSLSLEYFLGKLVSIFIFHFSSQIFFFYFHGHDFVFLNVLFSFISAHNTFDIMTIPKLDVGTSN